MSKIEQQVRDAYKKIFDLNWDQWGKDRFQSIDPTLFTPIFNTIPEEGVDTPDWLFPYLDFCPCCGFMGETNQTENIAAYPEQFTKNSCKNCGYLLGMVDNSPYMAWYEFKDNDFKVEI